MTVLVSTHSEHFVELFHHAFLLRVEERVRIRDEFRDLVSKKLSSIDRRFVHRFVAREKVSKTVDDGDVTGIVVANVVSSVIQESGACLEAVDQFIEDGISFRFVNDNLGLMATDDGSRWGRLIGSGRRGKTRIVDRLSMSSW